MNKQVIFLFVIISMLWSCEVINPEEVTPSFVRIDSLSIQTRPLANPSEGSPTADIVDAWIEVDNELIGAFELPALIPVLKNGPANLKIFGGVRLNGRNVDRIRYPFYDFSDSEIDLLPGESVIPDQEAMTLSYIPDLLDFSIVDFEDAGVPMTASQGSDTTIMRVPNPDPDEEYLEDFVGYVALSGERDFFAIETTLDMDLAFKNIVYLEFDYKTDQTFFMGVQTGGVSPGAVGLLGINPSSGPGGTLVWKKMYVNLSDVVDFLQNGDDYEIFFQAEPESGEANVYLDNIKVVRPL